MTVHQFPPRGRFAHFVEGEQVMLKSGGPTMTVLGYCEDCDEVDAAYGTSDGDVDILTLPSATIVRVQ